MNKPIAPDFYQAAKNVLKKSPGILAIGAAGLAAAELATGIVLAFNDGPMGLSGAAMGLTEAVGMLAAVVSLNPAKKALSRTICIAAPVIGIAVFGALHNTSESAHQKREAAVAQAKKEEDARVTIMLQAMQRCRDAKGTVEDLNGEEVCIVPDPPRPDKVIHDHPLNYLKAL